MSTFQRAVGFVSAILEKIPDKASVTVSVIQVSGIKEFAHVYTPGQLGRTHAGEVSIKLSKNEQKFQGDLEKIIKK